MDFPLDLHDGGDSPPYLALASSIRNAIESGRLRPGDALPGTPQLALQLGRSRSTVVRCYEVLLSQKYIESVPGKGTRVSTNIPVTPNAVQREFEFQISQYGQRLLDQIKDPLTSAAFPEVNFGAFPSSMLPVNQWRQILFSICREFDPQDVVYSRNMPLGYVPLREAIGAYLRRNRGVICETEQVCVFPGSLHAINSIARLLIDPGDNIAVENPGFPYARKIFESLGANIVHVPVDGNGLSTNRLSELPQCKLIYVTPSHQDPTGPTLPLTRRQELIRWAQERKVIIIEDDYDHEFRYEGSSLPALQGLDRSGLVIYLSSFWKILHPLSAAGFMVIPNNIIDVVSHAESLDEFSFPLLELLALTEFVKEGHLERHIKKSKPIYRSRLHTLIRSLAVHLRPFVIPNKESSGSHLLVNMQFDLPDEDVLRLAQKAGLHMISTSVYYANQSKSGEFLIGFAHLPEQKIERMVIAFAELLRERSGFSQTIPL